MAVRVEKAGKQRLTAKIDGFRAISLMFHDTGFRPNGEDASVLHGDRLCPRDSLIHRQDRPTQEYLVGYLLCGCGGRYGHGQQQAGEVREADRTFHNLPPLQDQ